MDPQWAAKVEGERSEIADLRAEYASGWIERARKYELVLAAQRDQHDQRQNVTSGATSDQVWQRGAKPLLQFHIERLTDAVQTEVKIAVND